MATGELVACMHIDAIKYWAAHGDKFATLELRHEYTEGSYCWIYRDLQTLAEPIFCRGWQDLWHTTG